MLSFINVKQLFENIANAHQMIKSFGFGELQEIEATTADQYTKLWVVPIQTQILNNVIQRQYRLLAFDLVDKGEVIENEVLSDTEKILNDVIKILKNESDEYNIVNDPILTPFTERFGDDVAGWFGEIVLESPYNNAYCDVPAFPFISPFVPDSGGISNVVEYLSCGDLIYCPTIIDIYNTLGNHEQRIYNLENTQATVTIDNYEIAYGTGTGITSSNTFVYYNENIGNGTTTPHRKYHQQGGKFLVESTDGSYGQFQIVNNTLGEVTLVLAADATVINNGTLSSSAGKYIWAFGLGSYGYSSENFIIGNNQVGGDVLKINANGTLYLSQQYNNLTNSGTYKFLAIDDTGKVFSTTASTGGGSSYTFLNGLTESSGVVKLGGYLTENTLIQGNFNDFSITGVQNYEISVQNDIKLYAGAGDSSFIIYNSPQAISNNASNNRFIVTDQNGQKGLVYASDYSSNFTSESLVSKHYVDNVHSSGLLTGGVVTINLADNSKIDITGGTGVIVDYWTDPLNIKIYDIVWSTQGSITLTNLATSTLSYIGIDINGNIVQYSTEPNNDIRRNIILLAQIGHTNNTTIGAVNSITSASGSPIEQIRDVISELHLVNTGNKISPNGANMQINKSNGYLFGLGLNYNNNIKNPHKINTPAVIAGSFRYRTQIGGTASPVNIINPTVYDNAGVITSIAGSNNQATNQRVYLFPNGNIVIQYGQTVYSTLANAISGLQTESFVEYTNPQQAAILIAIISVTKGCTALNNTSTAKIIYTTKFGENIGGVAGISVSTLQNVYSNSVNPEILTDSSRGALSIKRGSLSDTDSLFEGINGSDVTTSYINADGSSSFVKQTITNGVTHSAPSENTIYNALQAKADKTSELLSGGTITIQTIDGTGTNNDARVSAAEWFIVGFGNYQTLIDTDFLNITLSSTGLQRYIGFYGTTSNTIIKVEGTESEYAAEPIQPANTALIGYILVTDSAAGSAPDLSAYALINPRVLTITSSAAPTYDISQYDELYITALAADINLSTNMTGTVGQSKQFIIHIKDNGVARLITMGTKFAAKFAALPTTTQAGKWMSIGCKYNTNTLKFDVWVVSQEP